MKCYMYMDISQKMMDFIRIHAYDDVNTLRLKYSGKNADILDFNLDLALIQIEARKKARKKIPSYIENGQFLFPSLIAEEQASNEAVARFHASLIAASSSILDLTAGLGIDDLEFCKAGMSVTACEIDTLKSEVLRHNANVLDLTDRLRVINCNSIDYIQIYSGKTDVIFADPARRDASGGKVHALADCQPDILAIMPRIMKISSRLIVKASPLLDISLICKTVENLKRIYVVSFRGECKEVLMDINPCHDFEGITVVDLDWDNEISRFDFPPKEMQDTSQIRYFSGKFPTEHKYLYEPNAGIMKVADWKSLGESFPDLRKCDANTHIFISDTHYENFPGRILKMNAIPGKRELKSLKGSRYNIVARNYPLSAPQIAKKYGIISGGNDYLYAFRCNGNPVIVFAHPLRQDRQ